MNPGIAYLDLHVLQTVPPSCLNRDDTNSPKTAVYGGVRRARVSSQSWKRATRLRFNATLDDQMVGMRSKQLPRRLMDMASDRLSGEQFEKARGIVYQACGVLCGLKDTKKKKALSDYVKKSLDEFAKEGDVVGLPHALFLPGHLMETVADHVVDTVVAGAELDEGQIRSLLGGPHTLDIALFGRMVAASPDLNVDAACQVAHAISTHSVASEFDYFTTVDEIKADAYEAGDSMLGFVEFASATLYRFATVSVTALADNLGGPDPVPAACRLFAEAFTRSLPTGRQNTFAAHTPPDVVFAVLRTDQPVSLVGAFEKPVRGQDGHVAESSRRLAEHATALDDAYGASRAGGWHTATPAAGDLSGPLGSSSMPFPALLDAVEEAVTAATAARC